MDCWRERGKGKERSKSELEVEVVETKQLVQQVCSGCECYEALVMKLNIVVGIFLLSVVIPVRVVGSILVKINPSFYFGTDLNVHYK